MELWGLLLYLRPFCTTHLALAVCKPYPQKEQQWCSSGTKLAPQEGHSRSIKKLPSAFLFSGYRALWSVSVRFRFFVYGFFPIGN